MNGGKFRKLAKMVQFVSCSEVVKTNVNCDKRKIASNYISLL